MPMVHTEIRVGDMLTDCIFVIETKVGGVKVTLPEALARLCDGSLVGFEGLAAHQQHAWDLFLYQIAALALVRSGETVAAEDDAAWCRLADAAEWRQRLAALTPGCADTAWSLVVDDLTVGRLHITERDGAEPQP